MNQRRPWRSLAVLSGLAIGSALSGGWDPLSFPVGLDASRTFSILAAQGPNQVLMGGEFTQIGDVPASRVARWDGSRWQALGLDRAEGVNGPVLAIANAPDGSVYVGGAFSSAAGTPAWNIARWDGVRWTGMGGGLSGRGFAVVRALVVDAAGRVYAGGTFNDAGGVPVDHLAIWDGQRWQPWPGGGVRSDGVSPATVHAMAWRGSRLWVGGEFTTAGEVASGGIAEWNGTGWSSPGGGIGFPGFNPFVRTVLVRGNDVFVGGRFTRAGGVDATNAARWDGSHWNALGSGTDGAVSILRGLGSDVIAAGAFRTAGDHAAVGVARWDGRAWQALDGGVGGAEPVVTALESAPDGLWLAGAFTTAGGQTANGSARWSPAQFPPSGRILSPTAGTPVRINTPDATARIPLTLDATDPDGRVVSVEWYDGPVRFGETHTPPFGWEAVDVSRGSHLFWARLIDDKGSTTDTLPVDVEVDTPNTPPTVRIESPISGTRFEEGDRIVFRATATDADGRVVRVDFQDGTGALLTRMTAPPFEYTVTAAAPGTRMVQAVAVDDRGARVLSEPVQVDVNARPTVRIVSPLDGAVVMVTNEVRILVDASDADGRIERLTLLRDGQSMGSLTSPPFRFTLLNIPAGTNTYRVIALDNAGSTATSAPVQIQHQSVPLPHGPPRTYLAIQDPPTNPLAPRQLLLRAETLTQGASFQYHQFLVSGPGFGPIPLNNTYDTSNPAECVISQPASGSYEFRAVGWDLFGSSGTSAPVAVTIRSVTPPDRYRITFTSGLGGSYPTPTSLGADGSVVGYSDVASGSANVHAFQWKSGVLTDLTPGMDRSEAWDINAEGTVLGYTEDPDPDWSGMFLLDSLGRIRRVGGPKVSPLAMNPSGAAVGATRPGIEPMRPFLWSGSGSIRILSAFEGMARDIDSRGRVVGWSRPPGQPTRAFVWENDQFNMLSADTSDAWAINEVGQVVGFVGESDPDRRAVLWENGQTRVLGSLPGHNAQAAGINNGGIVVGWGRPMDPNAPERAMLWKDGMAHDLNAWVDDLKGVQLRRAVAVNDRGQIAGIAVDPATWRTVVFLATPISAPTPSGSAPIVRWMAPTTDGTPPRVGVPLEWEVEASDPDGPVARVEFRVGNAVVATSGTAPFRATWIPDQPGSACLSVAAWDGDGRVTVTPTHCLDVLPAPAPYEVVDLGPVADVESRATAINAGGDIVGFTRDEAFLDRAGVYTPWRMGGTTEAVAIGDDQTVALRVGSGSALVRGGTIIRLPFLSALTSETGVRSVNSLGTAVGWGLNGTRLRRAIRFSNGVLRDLGTLPGHTESDAFGINDSGVAIGWSQGNGQAVAVRWEPDGTLSALPDVAGFPVSRATAIHASGAIVGQRMNPSGVVEGALWTDGLVSVIRDLGIGGIEPRGVDRLHRVIGTASGRAFLWRNQQTLDLNAWIAPSSGWVLQAALGINDAGQIVGYGQHPVGDSTPRAFLLQPNPVVQTEFQHTPPLVELSLQDVSVVRVEGDSFTVQAAVRTQSGVIERVSFYENDRWVGDVTRRPYLWTATNRPAGTSRWTAVASDRFPSKGTSAPVSVVIHALPTNAPRVAVIGVGNAASVPWVQAALRRTLRFSAVDGFAVTTAAQVPSAAALESHDVLLVHGHGVAAFADTLGNVIAQRLSAGVGLIAAQHAGMTTALTPAAGALGTEGWLPWSANSNRTTPAATASSVLPEHPIFQGVTRLQGGPDLLVMDSIRPAPGSFEIARWSSGPSLAVVREVNRSRVVGLNLFPAPADQRFDSWTGTGDGIRLVANALAWAARERPLADPAADSVSLSVPPPASPEQPFYLPGEPIRMLPVLAPGLLDFSRVRWFTNGVLAGESKPGDGPWVWNHPPVGQHQVGIVADRSDGTCVASLTQRVRVDSRMEAIITSPASGSSLAVPGLLEIAVTVTNRDAAVVRVEFLRDGTERLGTVTNTPYVLRLTVGVGVQNLSARVTDALGAVRVTDTVRVTTFNPASPQVTSWRTGSNVWSSTNAWTVAVPRPQDRAIIDAGGWAVLQAPGGFASNLVAGVNGLGRLTVDAASLRVGKTLTLGDTATGIGELVITNGGSVQVITLTIGNNGTGNVAQHSGTVTATDITMAGNNGSAASYTLSEGLLSSKGLTVWGPVGAAGFIQSGGTNRINGFLVIGPRSQRTGNYRIEGGLLDAAGIRVASGRLEPACLEIMGGQVRASGPVTIGTEGQGRLVMGGGAATVASLDSGVSGCLDLQAQESGPAITVSGAATLRGRLVVRLAPGLRPTVGQGIPVLRYGSVQNELTSIELPAGADGLTWSLLFGPDDAILMPRPAETEIIVSPMEDGIEPGVFTRQVRVSNPGLEPLRGARIYVPGLPDFVELLNKTGVEATVPFVEYPLGIAPGTTAVVTLQFLSKTPGRPVGSTAVITVEDATTAVPFTQPLLLRDPTLHGDGSWTLRFDPEPNRRYFIEYSGDLTSWTRVPQGVVGTGGSVLWEDNGPPKTVSLPGADATRYYRLVQAP